MSGASGSRRGGSGRVLAGGEAAELLRGLVLAPGPSDPARGAGPGWIPVRLDLRDRARPTLQLLRRHDGSELELALDGVLARRLAGEWADIRIEVISENAAEALELRALRLLRDALVSAGDSLDSTLASVLEALIALSGAERGAIFEVENDAPRLRLARDPDGAAEGFALPQRVLERTLLRKEPFTSADVSSDPELYRDTVERLDIRSLLVLPWVEGGVVRALVYLDRRQEAHAFPAETLAIARKLADDLWRLLSRALDRERLRLAFSGTEAGAALGGFLTREPELLARLERVRRAADSGEPVLLLGESGTGKSLLAAGVHLASRAKEGPWVHVRLPEIAEPLFESELFGHERGAFTGAVAARRGLVEEANGGTLFLDEIGRVTATVQAKLLGILDGGNASFRRVGGSERRARFRVIAASSVDLERAAGEGAFLPDLWWRLSAGLVVTLPPLRERREDIVLLAEHLLRQVTASEERDAPALDDGARGALRGHSWPGNVRELRAAIQRAHWNHLARGSHGPILASDLALGETRALEDAGDPFDRCLRASGYAIGPERNLASELEHLRAWRIRRTLEACAMNESEAARRLGYRSSSTLRSQLQRLGIDRRRRLR